MVVAKKNKTLDDKIEPKETRYNSSRNTAKISALSSGNLGKYEYLTGENVVRK